MKVSNLLTGLALAAGLMLGPAAAAAPPPRVMPAGPVGVVRGVVDSVQPKQRLVIVDDRGYRLGATYRLNGVTVSGDAAGLDPGMRVTLELAPPSPTDGGVRVVRAIRTHGVAR